MAGFNFIYRDHGTYLTQQYSSDSDKTKKVIDEIKSLGYDKRTRQGCKLVGRRSCTEYEYNGGSEITASTTFQDILTDSGSAAIVMPLREKNNYEKVSDIYINEDIFSMGDNKNMIKIGHTYSNAYINNMNISKFSMLYIACRTAYPRNFETGIWVQTKELKFSNDGSTENNIYGIGTDGQIKYIKYKGTGLNNVSISSGTFGGINVYGII